MSSVFQCPSCPRTLEFFTDGASSSFGAWTEIVYQTKEGRVGFEIDQLGQKFISELLKGAWALNRDTRLFYKVDCKTINFHNLHNAAAIVVIRPETEILAAFDSLASFQANEKLNALRTRLGRDLVIIEEPELCCCTSVESRKVVEQCLDTIIGKCDASLLLRASDYGLTGALFSQSPKELSSLIVRASSSTGLEVVTVEHHEELPCW